MSTSSPKMPKKSSPALEKREEKLHKDLDHDGERGESKAHKRKVLGNDAKKSPEKKPEKKSAKKS